MEWVIRPLSTFHFGAIALQLRRVSFGPRRQLMSILQAVDVPSFAHAK